MNLGFDAITEGNTAKLAADILSLSASRNSGDKNKRKLVLTLPWPEKSPKPDEDVVEILNTVAVRLGTDC